MQSIMAVFSFLTIGMDVIIYEKSKNFLMYKGNLLYIQIENQQGPTIVQGTLLNIL